MATITVTWRRDAEENEARQQDVQRTFKSTLHTFRNQTGNETTMELECAIALTAIRNGEMN